jgi:hypothetical protein
VSWRAGLIGAVIVLAAAVGAVIIETSGTRPVAAAREQPVSTAKMQRRELSATISVPGTLTYRGQADGSPYPVINHARGTYTQLPAIGRLISQGQVLYRVDGNPVILLRGSTPAYRTLPAGATGTDVAELNADLVTLGYATTAELSPTSGSFGSATAAALEKLQSAAGLHQTGSLALGQAVFEPTALRVTALSALLGGSAEPGQTVVEGTSTARQVQVSLDASQQTEVSVGDRVSITLPNNQTTSGVIASVGTVASCASSSGSDGTSSASLSTGTGACSSPSSGSGTPIINVDITPYDPAATGTWDQAAVQVGITTARVPGALVVPIDALLARSPGGYAVEIVGAHGDHHLVPVSLGMFDDAAGLVQVTGSRLVAGQEVVVPTT